MIMIVAFFVVIAGLFLAVWLFVVSCWWVLKQASEANKYRQIMVAIAKQESVVQTGDSWEVSYKMNGAARTMIVEGKTEADALREFILKGGSPRGVTGIRKV